MQKSKSDKDKNGNCDIKMVLTQRIIVILYFIYYYLSVCCL